MAVYKPHGMCPHPPPPSLTTRVKYPSPADEVLIPTASSPSQSATGLPKTQAHAPPTSPPVPLASRTRRLRVTRAAQMTETEPGADASDDNCDWARACPPHSASRRHTVGEAGGRAGPEVRERNCGLGSAPFLLGMHGSSEPLQTGPRSATPQSLGSPRYAGAWQERKDPANMPASATPGAISTSLPILGPEAPEQVACAPPPPICPQYSPRRRCICATIPPGRGRRPHEGRSAALNGKGSGGGASEPIFPDHWRLQTPASHLELPLVTFTPFRGCLFGSRALRLRYDEPVKHPAPVGAPI